MRKKSTPRERKLDSIANKIAVFIAQETFTDEADIQLHLSDALTSLRKAAAKMAEGNEV